MNPPKRRAKRILNHPGNEDRIVNEDEKPFLNLVARLVVEVFFKDVLDIEEEQIIITKIVRRQDEIKMCFSGDKQMLFEQLNIKYLDTKHSISTIYKINSGILKNK